MVTQRELLPGHDVSGLRPGCGILLSGLQIQPKLLALLRRPRKGNLQDSPFTCCDVGCRHSALLQYFAVTGQLPRDFQMRQIKRKVLVPHRHIAPQQCLAINRNEPAETGDSGILAYWAAPCPS